MRRNLSIRNCPGQNSGPLMGGWEGAVGVDLTKGSWGTEMSVDTTSPEGKQLIEKQADDKKQNHINNKVLTIYSPNTTNTVTLDP